MEGGGGTNVNLNAHTHPLLNTVNLIIFRLFDHFWQQYMVPSFCTSIIYEHEESHNRQRSKQGDR